jgi:hypothetical protein
MARVHEVKGGETMLKTINRLYNKDLIDVDEVFSIIASNPECIDQEMIEQLMVAYTRFYRFFNQMNNAIDEWNEYDEG